MVRRSARLATVSVTPVEQDVEDDVNTDADDDPVPKRKIKRRKVAAQKAIEEEDEEEADDDDDELEFDDDEEEIAPKKKRRTKAKTVTDTKKVRGRRGILSSLKEFPLDVLFEIFGHLRPQDLLTLARTTKEFRALLMTRSSAFIWKESRSRVQGLPEITNDLSEPQYANLAFDGHCHDCLTSPVQTVIWSARIRLCKKCITANFLDRNGLDGMLEWSLIDLVPSLHERRESNCFPETLARRLKEETRRFRVDGTLQTNDPEYIEWLKRKRAEVNELNAHAELCAAWARDRTNARSDELDDARAARLNAITERLTLLGWGDEIPHHMEFREHRLVKQPKALTDRIWANIKDPLIEFLAEQKQIRLEDDWRRTIRERRTLAVQTYNNFVKTQPAEAILPPKYDVISLEPWRALIEDTPVEQEKLTLDSFAPLVAQISEFAIDWRRRADAELVEILQADKPDACEGGLCVPQGAAYTPEAIAYPRILVHFSASVPKWASFPPDELEPLEKSIGGASWNNTKTIRPHRRAPALMRAVVEACRLDPDVTTAQEMEEIDPVVECVNCRRDGEGTATGTGKLVMRWVQAEELLVEKVEQEKFKEYVGGYYASVREKFFCGICAAQEDDGQPKGEQEQQKPTQELISILRLKAHVKDVHGKDDFLLEHVKEALDIHLDYRMRKPLRWAKTVPKEPEAKEGDEEQDMPDLIGGDAMDAE
ncbi:hypothetical protein FB45DRAFT_887452 [Roridomyces roridus]|uniref:F-box domain-containing protein n=1 Tax=Roridomyces roridus TaxID=1738132 RepID=A0AAD7CIY8_9AGAR|nr:hypothetical protein FB45DRAFT_887452 [Roridomyces roridus]